MTYKQIEASRETRLWIGQILIPAATIAVSVLAIPEARAKAKSVWVKITSKFNKKTES